jgi:RNA polymerase sigma-32 factor
MTTAIAISTNAESTTVRRFIASAKSMPYLTVEQEVAAAKRVAEFGDLAAKQLLVNTHLRQVIKAAMGWARFGFSADDLIQEGSIGLIRAIEKFDVEKGFRLSTYANWWIKSCMQDYMLEHRSSVRIPNTAKNKKILSLLSKYKGALKDGGANSEKIYQKIAEAAESDVDQVRMLHGLSTGVKSFSDPLKDDAGEFGDTLACEGPLPDELVEESDELFRRREALARALTTLNEREYRVFKSRRMCDDTDILTLETLAEEFGVSRERIRQIEVRAFEKVEAFIRKEQLAERGEQLAKIASDKAERVQAALATIKPRKMLPAAPKKVAVPQKPKGWTMVTKAGKPELVYHA